MGRDRAKNFLRGARRLTVQDFSQQFRDRVDSGDQDDLFRINLNHRSQFTATLGRLQQGANVDLELYAPKRSLQAVLRQIGRTNFSDLTRQEIRRNLSRVGQSQRRGRRSESLNVTLDAGIYYLRVRWRSGSTRYTLNAAGETVQQPPLIVSPSPSPSPGSTPSPTPSFTRNWVRQIGAPGNDTAYGVTANATGVYLGGVLDGQDLLIARYNSTGTQIWRENPKLSGSDFEIAFDIAVDDAGNYYVVGISKVTSRTNLPANDVFIAKYGESNNLLWSEAIATSLSTIAAIDLASSVVLNGDYLYVAGFLKAVPSAVPSVGAPPVSQPAQAFVAKFQTADTITGQRQVWLRDYSSTTGSSAASSVAVDVNGDVYITGITNAAFNNRGNLNNLFAGGDAFVAKFNGTTGNFLWDEVLTSNEANTQDYGRGIAVLGTTVYITGETGGTLPGETSLSGTDGFLAKYTQDATGTSATREWINQFGTSGTDAAQAIAINDTGRIFLTGETNGGLFGNTPLGGSDAWLAEFSADGNLLRSALTGTPQDDEAYDIAVNGTAIYLVGQTLGALEGSNPRNYDAWIGRFTPI